MSDWRKEPRLVELQTLRDQVRVFTDRVDAGKQLVPLLAALAGTDAVLLAVPAGGVPVAVELAAALKLPLDVAVVSKVTLPWNTEVGCGAVAFDGTVRIDQEFVEEVGLTGEALLGAIERTREKVQRRMETLRQGRPPPDVRGRTAVLVDDGVASGFTLKLAVEAVRRSGAERVEVAVPTGPLHALEELLGVANRVYCANVRTSRLFAVADAYRRWRDESEADVARMLGV